MSAKSVCDMSCGQMHEFALVLDKAGFDADLVQRVVGSRSNRLAKAMYFAVEGEVTKVVSTEKFTLLVDLGVIVVPDDYDHATQLGSFWKKNSKKFYFYNDDITDANFAKATTKLVPGQKFLVKAFKQIVPGMTTSEERIAFLKSQNATLVGAQGASLVFEQKRDELPKGYWYLSFDEKDTLWESTAGRRRVPRVYAYSDDDFRFNLDDFEDVWRGFDAFLCFCDE